MPESLNGVLHFLNGVNKANTSKTKREGFPAREYNGIRLDPELAMFQVSSGYEIAEGYDGREEKISYYFPVKVLLPLIDQLMRNERAEIDLAGIRVFQRHSWDHSYASPEDDGYASICKGQVTGVLHVIKGVFSKYHLDFAPQRAEIRLESDLSEIPERKIKEKIREEIQAIK